MLKTKLLVALAVTGAMLALSASDASARGYYRRGPGPVLGLLGGVVVGAATIATLPFQVLGAAVAPAPRGYGYYGPPREAYGPPPPPPPRYYRQPYGPRRGYYGYGYY